jgi:hypothetical protein
VIDEKRENASYAGKYNNENLLKWHQRYGHFNVHNLKKMKNEDMVCGMNLMSKADEKKIARYVQNVRFTYNHLNNQPVTKKKFWD